MKQRIIIIVVILLVILAALAVFRPDLIRQAWLWLVGFAGLIFAGIQKFAKLLGPDEDLKAIEASNEEIKKNYAKIKVELETARHQLQQERSAQQFKIKQLEDKLYQQKSTYQELQSRLRHLQTIGYQEYLKSLSTQERKQIEDEVWSEVDFGL